VCSVLRRDGVLATPSPGAAAEILVAGAEAFPSRVLRRREWHADVEDTGEEAVLSLADPEGRAALCDLVEKALVMEMEAEEGWWRLSSSSRRWYGQEPVARVEGIEVVPRLSFATLPVAGEFVGVAFERGHLYRTEGTLADFLAGGLPDRERRERRREFDRLRRRKEGRKGTLLYDTGRTVVSVCYYDHERRGVTCGTTGRVLNSASLYEYCRRKYPGLGVAPEDGVVYVSFPGMRKAAAVAAKLLRLRVMPDGDPSRRGLDDYKTSPPRRRKADAEEALPLCRRAAEGWLGFTVEDGLWRPSPSEHGLLPCTELVFGQRRVVAPPARPALPDYQRYYRERPDRLRGGGVFRYEQTIDRKIHVVTPSPGDRWPDELQQAFLADFGDLMKDLVGKKFELVPVRADGARQARERLAKVTTPGTALVVFDDTTDESEYFLFAHHLAGWRLKRLTRSKLLGRWRAKKAARPGDGDRAQRRWRDTLFHSALDTLEQMDATSWRLRQLPYEACLTIDVSENRRYFAVSLLICRAEDKEPAWFRRTDVWTKADHQHEAINPRWLSDKVVEALGGYQGPKFIPLASLLALRDGRLPGGEERALAEAFERLKQMGRLLPGAVVDVAEAHKKTVKGLRAWRPASGGAGNLLEGHALYPAADTALVCCTGAATLSQGVTAEPCLLVLREGDDIRKVASAFFAMAQLNYSSPNKAQRLAYPLWATDERLRRRVAQDMRDLR
jgi:hypothetical protein